MFNVFMPMVVFVVMFVILSFVNRDKKAPISKKRKHYAKIVVDDHGSEKLAFLEAVRKDCYKKRRAREDGWV